MNPFNEHPHQQGISYLQHMCFAIGISSRLFRSVIAFTLHAIFPFIDIQRSLDLEATARFIQEQNNWIENSKNKKAALPQIKDDTSINLAIDMQ